MAKISPVSIKYMIHAVFSAEGHVEKPDVVGAIFGQTEGLLGADLEMRELQKEGKIGRIEVDLERENKRTNGRIKIPTALDQSETTLIAAAIETIDRIGPSDSQIEVEKIEDVRGSKKDYIVERAKKLMQSIEGSTDSREISNVIKDSTRMSEIREHGESKLPCGDLSGDKIIVVEGRADVLNLLKAGVKNVIAMNGTKMPDEIKGLSNEKEITLFIDGDRGGKLIAQNVTSNATIKYIANAPDGKEVEELTGKEVLMSLRKKIPVDEFFSKKQTRQGSAFNFNEENKKRLKEISKENEGSGKAILLDNNLNEIKNVSIKGLGISLKRGDEKPIAIVVDGAVTGSTIKSAEDSGVRVIVAKNFGANSEGVKLVSY